MQVQQVRTTAAGTASTASTAGTAGTTAAGTAGIISLFLLLLRGATRAKPAGYSDGLSQKHGRRKPCRFSPGRTSYVEKEFNMID